jgi:hypothetical protein
MTAAPLYNCPVCHANNKKGTMFPFQENSYTEHTELHTVSLVRCDICRFTAEFHTRQRATYQNKELDNRA